MKRSGPWLRWLALGLCVETSLWIFTMCRPFSDWQRTFQSSRPLLVHNQESSITLFENGVETLRVKSLDETSYTPTPEYAELAKLIATKAPPRGATRTRAGQLIDTHGRVLLDQIHEFSKFAYSPKHDLLVWETPSGSPRYGVNVRSGGKTRLVDTWGIDAIQILDDGTIWLAESQFPNITGISVLDRDGNFLGWRVRGNPSFVDEFCEPDSNAMTQIAHIKRSLNKK